MGIEFAYGRAGSGKSRYVLARIREILKDPLSKAVVIVPEQYTFQMERDIIDACGVPGFMGLSVLGFNRLVFRILEEAGGRAYNVLNASAKSMLVRLAIQQNGQDLKVFARSAKKSGFDGMMAELLSDLKRYDIDADTLLRRAADVKMPFLRDKAEDIALIYKAYEALMPDARDAEDLINTAIENAGDAPFLNGAHIVIDGFDMLTAQFKRLIAKCMRISASALITFRLDVKDGRDASLFQPEKEIMEEFARYAAAAGIPVTYKKLPDAAIKPRHLHPELTHLEKNLYAYPYGVYPGACESIRLFAAKSRTSEALFAAENILRLVRERNYRYRDIAILTDTASYADILKSVLMANGIPCFVDVKRSLMRSNLCVFIDAALSLVAGKWRLSDLNRLIKTGLSGLTQEETELLLDHQKQYGLRGYAFKKPFRHAAEAAEAARQKLMEPLLRLDEKFTGSVPERIDALLSYLDTVGAAANTGALVEKLETEGLQYEAMFYRQALEKTFQILQQAKTVFKNEALSSGELRDIIKSGFESMQIAVIPPTVDEVTVGDIRRSRLKSVKALFVMGLNEGVIPARTEKSGILSQDELEAFRETGVAIGEFNKTEAEKLRIYTVLTKPSEALFLSYAGNNGGASILIDRIKKIFPGLKTESDIDEPARLMILSPKGTLFGVARSLRDYLDGRGVADNLKEALSWYMKNGYENEIRAIIRGLLFENEPAIIGEENARALFGNLRGSVSRIEEYYACPYKHFIQYGLKAKEQKDFHERAADAGTLMHGAIDRFSKKLKNRNTEWKDAGEELLLETLEEAWQETLDSELKGFREDKRLSGLLSRLKQELWVAVKAIRWQMEGSEAEILGSELRYGTAEYPAYAFKMDSGEVAYISGCIDRADILRTQDGCYVRVVDYKLSDKKMDYAGFFAGIDVQLVVYLMVLIRYLKERGENAKPGGAYYFSFALPFLDKNDAGEGAVYTKKQMEGVTVDNIPVIKAFSNADEGGKLRAIRLTLRVNREKGEYIDSKGQNRVFDEEGFESLFAYTHRLIHEAIRGIYGGYYEVSPCTGGAFDACAYCGYARICRFDTGYDHCSIRKTGRLNKDELLTRIREV